MSDEECGDFEVGDLVVYASTGEHGQVMERCPGRGLLCKFERGAGGVGACELVRADVWQAKQYARQALKAAFPITQRSASSPTGLWTIWEIANIEAAVYYTEAEARTGREQIIAEVLSTLPAPVSVKPKAEKTK